MGTYEKIYTVVRQIPRGQVSTYGQIAAILGGPVTAREVGYAMAAVDDESVPWQRVINAKGEVSERGADGATIQRRFLESEGVVFDAKGRVDFDRFGWRGPAQAWLDAHQCFPAPPLGKTGRQMSMF